MLDWDDVRLFLAVSRHGGLAAAATATAKSPPTLGRRMLALERRTGLELFNRLPRGYALTAAGERLLQHALDIEARIAPFQRAGATDATLPIKVSAGQWVTWLLCQRAADVMAGVAVSLRFIADDTVLDISRREAVIAIRNQRPTQSNVAARRLGQVQFAVYAASPGIDCWVSVLGDTPSARWVRDQSAGRPCIEVTGARNALDLALSGVGRAVLPTFVGDTVAGVERIGQPIPALAHDQWMVLHNEERFERPVRSVIERLSAVLA